MDVFEVLYTTRAMRRFHPPEVRDISEDALRRLIDAAIRAPSAGNQQDWRFVVIRSLQTKRWLKGIYQAMTRTARQRSYAKFEDALQRGETDDERVRSYQRMMAGVEAMAEGFEQIPLLVAVAFRSGDQGYLAGGSVYPAIWSLQLAARALGIGSVPVGALARRGDEILRGLDAPSDEGWLLASVIALGYPTNSWSVPRRIPAHVVTFIERWGQQPEWVVAQPLWSPSQ